MLETSFVTTSFKDVDSSLLARVRELASVPDKVSETLIRLADDYDGALTLLRRHDIESRLMFERSTEARELLGDLLQVRDWLQGEADEMEAKNSRGDS